MKVRVAALAALSVLLPAACTGDPPAAPDRLVIAAGGPGEVHAALGEALAQAARDAWSAQVDVVATSGSVHNLQLVAEGRADVGFATVDVADLAVTGQPPFATAVPIRALARLYDDYLQVVTLASSGIDELAELADRRVSVGPEKSGTPIMADRLARAAGVTLTNPSDHSPRTSAAALAAGEIDAFVVAGGLPTPVVAELAATVPVRLLSFPELVADLQAQSGQYYQPGSIPAGSYPGVDQEVATVTVANVLVVRRDLPEDYAYRLTELLFDAKPELVAAHQEARRLDHRSAVATHPVPLHPGAERYYRAEKPFT
ncbi:MAG TPA: TAXI family TRAP transporter solute-binding subunit [Natronosporangium sp.]